MFEPIPKLQETSEAKVAKARELLTKDELFELMFI